MAPFDPALIRGLIDDHQQISVRLATIANLAESLAGQATAPERLALGARITHEANEFFAFYLAHMNREEATIVPAMKERFTDAQMGAMQGAVIAALTPDQVRGYLRWMFPSMNVTELIEFVGGVRQGAPAPMFEILNGIGAATMDPARWATVRERVGL
jgi:hypothetical protein